MARLAYILLAATILSATTWAGSISPRDYFDLVSRDDEGITIPDPDFRCPEAVGKEKMKCSEEICGGENPKKKGFCQKPVPRRETGPQKPLQPHYCHCDPQKGDGNNGDGAPIIPFPPPPAGFPPPPAGVPNPKQKDTCPKEYTDTSCEDCKPKSGWCTEGDHAGCPCREKCPADNKRPKCSDDDCKGDKDDNKCSIGLYKDCECESNCPKEKDDQPDCKSDKCKGEDGKCTTGEHEGCECRKDKAVAVRIDINPGSPSWMDKQQEVLEKIKKAVEKEPEADKKPKCVATGGTGVNSDDFIKMRDEFCKAPTKKYEKDTFTLELKKSKSGDCPKDDCVKTLNKLWNTCGDYHSRPDTPPKDDRLSEHHGPLKGSGEAESKCGKYSFSKKDPEPKFKPPGEDAKNPFGGTWQVGCDSIDTNEKISKDDVEKAIKDFCIDGRSLTEPGSFYKSVDVDGGVLVVSGRPDPLQKHETTEMYEDENACYDFDLKIRADDCEKALRKVYDECEDDGKYYDGFWYYNCVRWQVAGMSEAPKSNDDVTW